VDIYKFNPTFPENRVKMEKMLDIVVVTRKFQVTLTKEVRNRLEIKEGDKIVFVEKDGEIVIRKC